MVRILDDMEKPFDIISASDTRTEIRHQYCASECMYTVHSFSKLIIVNILR